MQGSTFERYALVRAWRCRVSPVYVRTLSASRLLSPGKLASSLGSSAEGNRSVSCISESTAARLSSGSCRASASCCSRAVIVTGRTANAGKISSRPTKSRPSDGSYARSPLGRIAPQFTPHACNHVNRTRYSKPLKAPCDPFRRSASNAAAELLLLLMRSAHFCMGISKYSHSSFV
jgi:hypothetical protein